MTSIEYLSIAVVELSHRIESPIFDFFSALILEALESLGINRRLGRTQPGELEQRLEILGGSLSRECHVVFTYGERRRSRFSGESLGQVCRLYAGDR